MERIKVDVVLLYQDVVLPEYQTERSAGQDVRAYLNKDKYPDGKIELRDKAQRIIPTGLKLAIPDGYELQVRPRSGLSFKTKLRIANSPGTVDGDYRDEVGIIVENIGEEVIVINHGDRIAQFVYAPIVHADYNVKDKLDETTRKGGFGSTGLT